MNEFNIQNDVQHNLIPKCLKCGSLYISIDISTNKKICQKCGNKDNFESIDTEDMKEQYQEQEEQNILDKKKIGIQTFYIQNPK